MLSGVFKGFACQKSASCFFFHYAPIVGDLNTLDEELAETSGSNRRRWRKASGPGCRKGFFFDRAVADCYDNLKAMK